MSDREKLRVGVLFGGRSGEHEVSLASARNVMEALAQAGHEVVPLGITRVGQWLLHGEPMKMLSESGSQTGRRADGQPVSQSGSQTVRESASNGAEKESLSLSISQSSERSWSLLPHANGASPTGALDVIFPVLHGPYGEDGTVQGLLEMANLPYVGCGVLASALAMDKVIAKKMFAAEGLPQTDYRVILRERWQREGSAVLDELVDALAFPLFVKPANMGSSVGVSRATSREALAAALHEAARYDRKLVVEQAVAHAREIEVSVLETLDGNVEASVPGEIVPPLNGFYDYAAKYENDSSDLLIPADLDAAQTARVREMAVRAFAAIDGSGLARVDFLLDGESGMLYLNEVNTMPGFTRISMYPKLWAASGVDYPTLVDRLVRLALARHADRQRNSVAR